jgi:hypothetical protein
VVDLHRAGRPAYAFVARPGMTRLPATMVCAAF